MEFKDRLRQFRQERVLSAAEIAVVFKKSEGAIRMWETGRAKPDADTLIKLAEYFECSVDYLLGLTAYRNSAEHHEHRETVIESIGRFEDTLSKLDNHVQEALADTFANTIAILANLPHYSDTAITELIDITEYIGKVYQQVAEHTAEWSHQNLLMLISGTYAYLDNIKGAMNAMLEAYLTENVSKIDDAEQRTRIAEYLSGFYPRNVLLKEIIGRCGDRAKVVG